MNQNQEDTNAEPESDYNLFEESFQTYLLKGADEIRQKLGLSDTSFEFMSHALNNRGRKHYIYEVLNEIEQVTMALMDSQETLSKPIENQHNDEVEKRLFRNTFTLIEREQSLHLRRLVEILVELINFSQINFDEYYDHYLSYMELSQRLKRKYDYNKYFECENLNNQSAITALKQSITWAEKKIDIGKCWYLQKGKNLKPSGESKIEKFDIYFDKSLPIATKAEKFLLGFYYGQSYRHFSQTIHLNIGNLKTVKSFDSLRANRIQIKLLAIVCLLKCCKLLGMKVKNGVVAELIAGQNVLDSSAKTLYEKFTKPSIKKGDFVSVFSSLCEVLSVAKSKFGYRSFKLKFLTNPLIHDVDWYPAFQIEKVRDGKQMRDSILKLLTIEGKKPIINPKIVRKAMRDNITEFWNELTNAYNKR